MFNKLLVIIIIIKRHMRMLEAVALIALYIYLAATEVKDAL